MEFLLSFFRRTGRAANRHPILWGTFMVAIAILPALFTPLFADERFVIYLSQSVVGNHIWELVPRVVSEINGYLSLGVFRPLSRLLFYVEHWGILRMAQLSGIQPHILLAISKISMLGGMLLLLDKLLKQYQRLDKTNPFFWDLASTILPAALLGLLVLKNIPQHPLTLFPLLYLGAFLIALGLTLGLGRYWFKNKLGRKQLVWGVVLYALAGIALASMIELVYIAIPLGAAHLTLLGTSRWGWNSTAIRKIIKAPTTFIWLAMVLGFLTVFVPTRLIISSRCEVKTCYEAASPALGGGMVGSVSTRVIAPVAVYAQGAKLAFTKNTSTDKLLITLIVVSALGILAAKFKNLVPHLRKNYPAKFNFVNWAPILLFGVMILFAALIAAISKNTQASSISYTAWRDTAFSWPAWAGVFTLGFSYALLKLKKFPPRLILLVIIALSIVPTVVYNFNAAQKARVHPVAVIHSEIGAQLVQFDTTDSGNSRRCLLIEQLQSIDPAGLAKSRVISFTDTITRKQFNLPFCQN